MTLEMLNAHLNLVDRLSQARELRATLLESARPGSNLTGMPHAPGVHDKVGDLGVELADIDDVIEMLQEEIARSEEPILMFIRGISDIHVRTIFRLRFIRGLSWKDVSRIMGRYTTEKSVSELCYKYLAGE